MSIARPVSVRGNDAGRVADELIERLAAPDLALAVVFAADTLDLGVLASRLAAGLAPAATVGCSAAGLVGDQAITGDELAAVAIGLSRDVVRVGIGVAPELSKSPLVRSRDAVVSAANALGATPVELDPARHVAFTLLDPSTGHDDEFCIGSAAIAPQIRMVGGAAGVVGSQRACLWVNGEVLADAGIIVLLDCSLPFDVVTSCDMVATNVRTVVTAATGRVIDELDGRPAGPRLHDLVAGLGGTLDDARPVEYSFARFIDGVPYVRTLIGLDGPQIRLAVPVEPGHVLRLMKPGDLVGVTRRHLADAAQRVGGQIGGLLAFSCIARHWDARSRGLEAGLAQAYGEHPTIGFHSLGEQSGMLLVNHTLTALAIGARPGAR